MLGESGMQCPDKEDKQVIDLSQRQEYQATAD